MEVNDVSGAVVDAAMKVHRALGPGLLESAYEGCLAHELWQRGYAIKVQHAPPVFYEGAWIEVGYRLDIVVNGMVIVER